CYGSISRLGNSAEKHAIGILLSLIDLLFFELGRETADDADITDKRGRRSFSKVSAKSALSVVRFIAALLSPGNPKQAFRGHVACGTWPLCLVAKRASLPA